MEGKGIIKCIMDTNKAYFTLRIVRYTKINNYHPTIGAISVQGVSYGKPRQKRLRVVEADNGVCQSKRGIHFEKRLRDLRLIWRYSKFLANLALQMGGTRNQDGR